MGLRIAAFFKKRDVQVIGVVILLIFISLLLFNKPEKLPAAYVRITTGDKTTIEKLEPHEVVIDQGGGMQNIVEITKNGAHMKSASCENQDCVHQGEVTQENVKSRLLSNWIICLPNQVSVELITEEGK